MELTEELRETLTLVSKLLDLLKQPKVSKLFDEYLSGEMDDEGNTMSNSQLNDELEEYLQSNFMTDNSSGARIVELGGTYLPLGVISYWKTDEKYSFVRKEKQFRLIINPVESMPGKFQNLVICYETEEERKKDIDKLVEMKFA